MYFCKKQKRNDPYGQSQADGQRYGPFRADSQEDATAKVLRTLKGAEVEEYAPGAFLADFSDAFFYSVVRAVVEPMSEKGRYAASFQEANRCRCILWPFPSRKAWRRMDRIKAELRGEWGC